MYFIFVMLVSPMKWNVLNVRLASERARIRGYFHDFCACLSTLGNVFSFAIFYFLSARDSLVLFSHSEWVTKMYYMWRMAQVHFYFIFSVPSEYKTSLTSQL